MSECKCANGCVCECCAPSMRERFLTRNLRHSVETERKNSLEFNNGSTLRVTEVTAHLTVEIVDHEDAHRLAKIIADFFEGIGK